MSIIFRSLLSASILVNAAIPAAAIDGNSGKYLYRYKENTPIAYVPDTQEKDVVAYFIAGVGYEFSEILPLKPQWEDDSWEITSGTLPEGITFDKARRTFVGTPTSAGSNSVVFLTGTDSNGAEVATAKVSFDVRTIQGVPVKFDIYAHTGKYKLAELQIPAGITVDRWESQNFGPLPPGIVSNSGYFEGTPTQAGQWQYMMVGLDYTGKAVVTFYGKYLVEDRPTFPSIANDIRKLPQLEWGYNLKFDFGAPQTHKIKNAIDPSKPVRYFVEVHEDSPGLPGSVSNIGQMPIARLKGEIWEPYTTATIRYKAIDSDGVEGWSDWFTFGSSDPQPACNPYYSGYPLKFQTGRTNTVRIPSPFGDQGTPNYSIASGSLPDGLDIVAATGEITGVPLKSGQKTQFQVLIEVINQGGTVSTTCSYNTEVKPGGVSVSDATPAQDQHVRLGDIYNGTATIIGGIPSYSLALADNNYPDIGFTSPTTDSDTVTLGGPVTISGANPVKLTLTNGDGSTQSGSVTIIGHGEVDVLDMPTVTVKRLAATKDWASVPYDASTIIPDMSGAKSYPAFTLDVPAQLPAGIALKADGKVNGATSDKAGEYGPFVATMQDFSGDKDSTNQFKVVVEERDRIEIAIPEARSFTVENPDQQTSAAPVVTQPPLAKNFTLKYALSGPTLPTWLSFDTDTGVFTAKANIPYADKNDYGPYTITVTDSDNSTNTTAPFDITAADWPDPKADTPKLSKGNISGDTSSGETATWLNITGIRNSIHGDTVIGGKDNVVFGAADPSSPAGLTWDPAQGSFYGRPTSEFNGNVTVAFEDTRGRDGTLIVPIEVRQYPQVAMTQDSYEIARLSEARTIGKPAQGIEVAGFWNTATWSLDTTRGPSLPAGLSVDPALGRVVGQTSVAIGTKVEGLVLKATSIGGQNETLESWTAPFSIEIVAEKPITLEYKPTTATIYLNQVDRELGIYTLNSSVPAVAATGGSYVKPLTYSLDKTEAVAAGMTGTLDINAATGALTGFPDKPGEWTVYVNLKDNEGRKIDTPTPLVVKATLPGTVMRSNGGGSFNLRQGEPFKTDALSITNVIGTPVYSVTPATTPVETLAGFDPTTGAFSDASYFPGSGSKLIYVNVKDAHGRTFGSNPASYGFTVYAPLTMTATPTMAASRQYDKAKPININFAPKVLSKMGIITYGLDGEIPGTLVSRVYDEGGIARYYYWSATNRSYSLKLDDTGLVTEYTVDGSRQPTNTIFNPNGTTSPAPAETYFPLDALVFDTAYATLVGIPSKSGNFTLTLTVSDSHAKDYIRDVTSRTTNNSAAAAPFSFTVEEASSFEVSNNASTETVAQYTGIPTIASTTTGAAYGAPVSWVQTGGALPSKITASRGTARLGYTGYPDTQGTWAGITWRATDAAGRHADTDAATIKVGPRNPLEIVAGMKPAVYLVNKPISDNIIEAKYFADGKVIPKGDWTVTNANLPTGLTYEIKDGRVVLSGNPTLAGNDFSISVSAKDSRGANASLTLPIRIILPTDEIALTVSDFTTKVGYPFHMQSAASNTYGTVRFYSADISSELGGQLTLDPSTGLVTGTFATTGDRDFDIYVTDETNRVTSKPVIAKIIPDLRVTVPTIVQATQGATLARAVTTDYFLGSVAYEKGAGDWPVGLKVNKDTGALYTEYLDPVSKTTYTTVVAASGDYAGLTIKAVDTFVINGVTYTDEQESNSFTIKVAAADLIPDISDPAKTILGTEGTALTWSPTVKDTKNKQPWVWAGTTYTASHELAQYGLTFDKTTGQISGTPTKGFIIRDFTVTVTSQRGDSDVTKPFWIGVAPKDAMKLPATFEKSVAVRKGDALVAPELPWENAIGNLTHVKVSGDNAFAVTTATGKITAVNATTNWAVKSYPVVIKVTDEFNRTATDTMTMIVLDAFVTTVSSASMSRDADKVDVFKPVTTGGKGNITYTATGLPPGISINPTTGALSGKVPNTVDFGTIFTVSLTAKDDYALLPAEKTITYTIKIVDGNSGHRFWRLVWTGDGTSNPARIDDLQFLGEDGTNYSLRYGEGTATVLSGGIYKGWGTYASIFDANHSDGGVHSMGKLIGLDFGAVPVPVKKIIWRFYTSSVSNANNISAQFSDNGTDWTDIYVGVGREINKTLEGDW